MATERMDVSKTLLRIRGFGDVSFHGDNQSGDNTSFSLGQLDLFVTSDLSERFRFLSEIVFEAGPDNIYGAHTGSENQFGVDLERYLIQYSLNEHLNLSLGRGHTAIGYLLYAEIGNGAFAGRSFAHLPSRQLPTSPRSCCWGRTSSTHGTRTNASM